MKSKFSNNPKKNNSPVYGERHPNNLFKPDYLSPEYRKYQGYKAKRRDKELQKRYNKLKEDAENI